MVVISALPCDHHAPSCLAACGAGLGSTRRPGQAQYTLRGPLRSAPSRRRAFPSGRSLLDAVDCWCFGPEVGKVYKVDWGVGTPDRVHFLFASPSRVCFRCTSGVPDLAKANGALYDDFGVLGGFPARFLVFSFVNRLQKGAESSPREMVLEGFAP